MRDKRRRIVILGGGFGGVYTAKYLHSLFSSEEVEICLVNRDNYMTFQPMLAEVIGDALGVYDTVSALSSLLPKTSLYINEIEKIDLDNKKVFLICPFKKQHIVLEYNELVLALGNSTDFIHLHNGVAQHALRFKNLSDTLILRNHIINVFQAASTETNPQLRQALLTFVIGGAGFTGTEVAAEVCDFLNKMLKKIPSIKKEELRVFLVHSKDIILNELSPSLGRYAMELLRKKGVTLKMGMKVEAVTPHHAVLSNHEKIASKTVISTAPANLNLVLAATKGLPVSHDRIKTLPNLQVEGYDHVWALGDAAHIPLSNGHFAPPTAQFAVREANTLAKNIAAKYSQRPLKPFQFKPLGLLAALGHRKAVGELFGFIKISGFLAWIMWRAIYWSKMPGLSRKLKVLFTWILDLFIPSEPVVLNINSRKVMHHLHYKASEMVFDQGDLADFLYIILKGRVAIIKKFQNEGEKIIKELAAGNFFGEIALTKDITRTAKVVCLESTDLIAIPKDEFLVMKDSFLELDTFLTAVQAERLEELNKFKKSS
ncbi:MAG: cyclic nucleotide-binding domain-containing protein [Chlamydiae bacterium]|nr:cyclic nucleotide-binding domain-containing protein [Chlamydiota bacterium]